jgi:hypothetical protein
MMVRFLSRSVGVVPKTGSQGVDGDSGMAEGRTAICVGQILGINLGRASALCDQQLVPLW